MIPRDYITEWRARAPWVEDFQVEQDLIISRALVEIFRHPLLAESLAFRGGTALYKLFIDPPLRYSEDIDLVQIKAEPAGPVMDALREVLDPWIGEPKWKQSAGRITLNYRFDSEDRPPIPLRLKVEINTREHFSVYGLVRERFSVASRWFSGECDITTFCLEELLATKLRALYQRKKGRDLFDLGIMLRGKEIDPGHVITAFLEYMKHGDERVTRAQFEKNLDGKLKDRGFMDDIEPLLVTDLEWDREVASEFVYTQLVGRLPGEPWKGEGA